MTAQPETPLISFLLRPLRLPRLRWPDLGPASVETNEEIRSRRAYLDEVMRRAPAAFHSELDVQAFLSTTPRSF